MQQVQQNYRSGELGLVDGPVPALRPGGILVATACSLISAGTERTTVATARKGLFGKAASRPDLVRQVVRIARREGLLETYRMVRNRLDTQLPLGYSSAGYVAAVAEGVDGLRPGDRDACAGSGYASHAEVVFVPRNLVARLPAGVALEDAAYATLGAIALQGVRRAEVSLGDRVAVIGLGLIGQLTVQILKAAGCRVLAVDLADDLVDLARRSGADLALARRDNPEGAAHLFGASLSITATTSSEANLSTTNVFIEGTGQTRSLYVNANSTATPGTYAIVLSLEDGDGNRATRSFNVVVQQFQPAAQHYRRHFNEFHFSHEHAREHRCHRALRGQ